MSSENNNLEVVMENNTGIEVFRIDYRQLILQLVFNCLWLFTTSYSITMVVLDNSLSKLISMCMIIIMVDMVLGSLMSSIKTYYIIKHYNNEYPINVWNRLLPYRSIFSDNFIYCVKICAFISDVILAVKFIPFSDCNNISNRLCFIIQIRLVILFTMLIVVFLLLIMILIVYSVNNIWHSNNTNIIERYQINKIIKRLPSISNTNDTCIICLDNDNKDILRQLECGHIYHQNCIIKWLKINNSCPFCRKQIN